MFFIFSLSLSELYSFEPNFDFIQGINKNPHARVINKIYFLVSIMSLVCVRSLKIAPAEQLKKFQGAIPTKTEKANSIIDTFKCGKLIFISQFGEPGNSLRNIR